MLLCPMFKTYDDDPNKGYMFVKFSNLDKEQNSRHSSPMRSSDMLDSLCPNCCELLSQASQPSNSAILKNAQQCSTMFNNALKHSDMLINAQQCSIMLRNAQKF